MNTQTQSICRSTKGKPHESKPIVFRPHVDVAESENGLRLYLDVPGTRSEDITIEAEGDELRVHAVVPNRQSGSEYVTREYAVGSFRRSFVVDESLDLSGMEAEYKRGVLLITINKKKKAEPTKIQVRVS